MRRGPSRTPLLLDLAGSSVLGESGCFHCLSPPLMQGLVRNSLSLAEFHMEGSESPSVESVSVQCTGPTSCRASVGAGGMRGRKGNQVPAGPGILLSQPSPDKGQ